MQVILTLLVSGISVLIAAYVVPGIKVNNFWVAIVVAIVLALLNTFLRPIFIFLTLPINILTLGLFTLVINAVIILIAGNIVPGFSVSSFWSALFFGLILSLVNWLLEALS